MAGAPQVIVTTVRERRSVKGRAPVGVCGVVGATNASARVRKESVLVRVGLGNPTAKSFARPSGKSVASAIGTQTPTGSALVRDRPIGRSRGFGPRNLGSNPSLGA